MDMNVHSDDLGFQNPKLAHRLMKAVILLRVWEVTNSHRLDEIVPSFYLSLLKVTSLSLFYLCLTF